MRRSGIVTLMRGLSLLLTLCLCLPSAYAAQPQASSSAMDSFSAPVVGSGRLRASEESEGGSEGSGEEGVPDPVPAQQPTVELQGVQLPTPSSWHRSGNSAEIGGLELRDLLPALTSKWRTVQPVDITRDGIQVFPLVASNE